jgi:hypothetical protein
MFISYILKTFKLLIVILNISYFLGMFWITFCKLSLQIYYSEDNYMETFDLAQLYEFWDKQHADYYIGISAMYFSFTSLSTVGFGDYHPRSNVERVLTAFILLFGVAVFSYCMGTFVEILQAFQELNKDFDQGDELTMFLQIFQRFNGGKALPNKITEGI